MAHSYSAGIANPMCRFNEARRFGEKEEKEEEETSDEEKEEEETSDEEEEEEEEMSDEEEFDDKTISEESDEDETESEMEDEDSAYAWGPIVTTVFEKHQDNLEEETRRRMEAGKDVEGAKRSAYKALLPLYEKSLAKVFLKRLIQHRELQKDKIYLTLKDAAREVRYNKDYDYRESYQYALKKRRFLLQRILTRFKVPPVDPDRMNEVVTATPVSSNTVDLLQKQKSSWMPLRHT